MRTFHRSRRFAFHQGMVPIVADPIDSDVSADGDANGDKVSHRCDAGSQNVVLND